MKISIVAARFALTIACASALNGCYGTKVPPPQASALGPPGLNTLTPGPDHIALPHNLTELLLVYRQWLIDKNHHISPDLALNHADAEIQSLTRQYSGREDELRAEIAQRIQLRPPKPRPPSNQIPANVYPSDSTQSNREDLQ